MDQIDQLDQAMAPPLILGIETSCDDTACALVDGSGRVLASVVSSQPEVHRPYGGVVPEYASREHLASWPPVMARAFEVAGKDLSEVTAVAATRGPGLVGSLLVGLSLGKALAYSRGLPFHAVHHLEGHLYSPFLGQPVDGDSPAPAAESIPPIPATFAGLVVSGGHTNVFAVDGREIRTLAQTRDDAMGEVFDKVGKRLGLPFPQGPIVDRWAEQGDPKKHPMTLATFSDGRLDFSYSGLKSQALLAIDALEKRGIRADANSLRSLDGEGVPQPLLDLLAGFRQAAVDQVLHRLRRLRSLHGQRGTFDLLAVSGGAAANRLLRRSLVEFAATEGFELRLVPLPYSGDNAAMIALAGLLAGRAGERDDPRDVDVISRQPLDRA